MKPKKAKTEGKSLLNRLAEGSKDVREILHTVKDLAVIGAVAFTTIFGVRTYRQLRSKTPEQIEQQVKIMQEEIKQNTEDKDPIRQTNWKLGGKFGGWILKKFTRKNSEK